MSETRWRDHAESVGIVAIVASLVFVGIQIRQDVRIAEGEAVGNALASTIEISQFVANHTELIDKANAGEKLSGPEELILLEIAKLKVSEVIFRNWQFRELGEDNVESAEQYLAAYLYLNPGLRAAYLQVTLNTEELVDPLRSPESLKRTYDRGTGATRARIDSYLDKLDDLRKD